MLSNTGEIAAHYRKIHLFDVDVPNGPVLLESRTTIAGNKVCLQGVLTRCAYKVCLQGVLTRCAYKVCLQGVLTPYAGGRLRVERLESMVA